MDWYEQTGIRKEPVLLRFRLLDPALRTLAGGLEDISALAEQVKKLVLPLQRVYIVENLQTGLAFTDLAGAAVIMGLGYSVDLLKQIDWLKQTPCYYRGDLDTHGFAILNRLRHHLPHARAILMDEAILMAHKHLWCREEKPATAENLTLLTELENRLYQDLRTQRWGAQLRLEQERIPWTYAWTVITADPA